MLIKRFAYYFRLSYWGTIYLDFLDTMPVFFFVVVVVFFFGLFVCFLEVSYMPLILFGCGLVLVLFGHVG